MCFIFPQILQYLLNIDDDQILCELSVLSFESKCTVLTVFYTCIDRRLYLLYACLVSIIVSLWPQCMSSPVKYVNPSPEFMFTKPFGITACGFDMKEGKALNIL